LKLPTSVKFHWLEKTKTPTGQIERRAPAKRPVFVGPSEPAKESLTTPLQALHRSKRMSRTFDTPSFQPAFGLEPLRAKWGWIVALGVVYVVAGFIALGSIVTATVASVFVVGIMMLIAGVFEVINAFQIKTWGRFLLWLVLGVLYIIAGILTFENPLLAAAMLTLVLGAALVASGIMRILVAFGMKEATPWIWVVLSGVVTFLLGLVILAHWPVSSLYVLGIFLGVDLVIAGASWIGIGLGLKRAA